MALFVPNVFRPAFPPKRTPHMSSVVKVNNMDAHTPKEISDMVVKHASEQIHEMFPGIDPTQAEHVWIHNDASDLSIFYLNVIMKEN